MPAAKVVEETGESSTAATKAALSASTSSAPNYELPWCVHYLTLGTSYSVLLTMEIGLKSTDQSFSTT